MQKMVTFPNLLKFSGAFTPLYLFIGIVKWIVIVETPSTAIIT